eukprot:jgi/Chlat1/2411/Chrsp17S02666
MEEPPQIRRLDEAVVNRIAAGEVIIRPCNAVKEMLENSLDAGSTAISIVVKDGGLKLLQIQDNGHGIRKDDMPILCERHTTSKLRGFEDLRCIGTLGFRGEALSSISYVAHLSVTTMTTNSPYAWRALYKDGKLVEPGARPCAGVNGTLITVEDLFYNVITRRSALKSPSEEYNLILDTVGKYAIYNTHVSFSCKKHGETRSDIHTQAQGTRLDAIRSIYGPSVAKELIPIKTKEDDESVGRFEAEGLISSANYSGKRTNFILFINERLVECTPLKRALEAGYATVLPKASKPFIFLSVKLPASDVDVNMHPTKKQVSFLNQESIVDRIQRAIEGRLLASNTRRTFYTQTLLPGNTPPDAEEASPGYADLGRREPTQRKAPEHKLVRTDAKDGNMKAYMARPTTALDQEQDEMARMRRSVRQRRQESGDTCELSSVQELLQEVDKRAHAGLVELVQQHKFVGMADSTFALLQHNTKLYLVNVNKLSQELMYQNTLRRFGRFPAIRLSEPAPLGELLEMALDEEEAAGRYSPSSDGPKDEVTRVSVQLLKEKADMLREYFALDINPDDAQLRALPAIVDHYTPAIDGLPKFLLALTNEVDWDSEKACFESVARAIATLYACHADDCDVSDGGDGAEKEKQQREWNIEHVLLPAMRLFVKPPACMATDGSAIQVACLETLYKIFERC